MRRKPRLIAAALAPGLALALWLILGAVAAWSLTNPAERAILSEVLAPLQGSLGALVFGWWAVAAALGAWVVTGVYRRTIAPLHGITDATRMLVADPDAPGPLAAAGQPGAIAAAINQLAGQSRALRADMARLVDEASAKVAQERDQLGALMAQLEQSVIVCNLDGRILLYNGRARGLFHRLSQSPDIAGGAELIGLGRSIHAVIEPALIAHARDSVTRRIARSEIAVSARFVTTTPAGHLLQVVLAPVQASGGAADAPMSGYVLLLDDITAEQAAQSRRDRRLIELTESSRASLASMQAALDMLDYPDLDDAERESFQAVVRDEVRMLASRLATLTDDASHDLLTRWPLQDMQGGDLIGAVAQRIEADTGRAPVRDQVDDGLWLSVDSFSLMQALAFLAGRLQETLSPDLLEIRLNRAGAWAHLDLAWPAVTSAVAPAGLQAEAMPWGEGTTSLTPREIAERHGGELWLEHDRDAGRSFFRFLLPLSAGERSDTGLPDRPEFYNFDLFADSDSSRALDDVPLDELAFTVFDTETTGLDPSGGDEIIQLGAIRILKARLLGGETFDQLVDPGRMIPEASIPFHGITQDMVRGKPRIAEVLAAFHPFAAETVLVGHNVAFDMRFLQIKEAATGLHFDQPVLDTLLLATVIEPHQPSYALEEIAARLGVEVSARHSAAGDALTTAQMFLKMLPLLRQQGIVTLGQAREAAEKSYYARLRY